MHSIIGKDESIWDCIKTIPFNARFEKGVSADLDLLPKLKAEAEGILAWLVKGCVKWQSEGLIDCQTVKDTTKAYRTQEDSFAHFLNEKIIPKPGSFLTAQAIWEAYNKWAKDNGEREIASTTRVGMEMSPRGYKGGTKNNIRGYHDIEFA